MIRSVDIFGGSLKHLVIERINILLINVMFWIQTASLIVRTRVTTAQILQSLTNLSKSFKKRFSFAIA